MWQLVGHWRLPDKYKLLHLNEDKNDALPSKFRRKIIPKIWYFMVNSGAVFFLPFLGIYWRKDCGFTTRQIGVIQALRPWVSAAAGYVLVPISDTWSIHYIMLLLTYAFTMISRGLITMDWSYGVMLVLVLIMESAVSVMSILVDATVVAGSVKDGTYGRARLWASVGWGGFAPVAGVILQKSGMHAVFMIFVIIYSLAFIPTVLIPAKLLAGAKRRLSIRPPPSTSSSDSQVHTGSSIQQEAEGKAPAITSDSNGGGTTTNNTTNNSSATQTAGIAKVTQQSVADPVIVIASSGRRSSIATAGSDINRRTSAAHQDQHQFVEKDTTTASELKRRTTDTHRPIIHLAVDAQSTQSIPEIIIHSEATTTIPPVPPTETALKGNTTNNNADLSDDDDDDIKLSSSSSSTGPKSSVNEADGHDLPFNHLDLPGSPPESLWAGLKKLLCDVYVLTFFFKTLLMGIGNGFVGYLFLFLSDLGASGTLLGLCLTMNCIAEVPVFYFSGIMIKRLGVQSSLNLGMAAFVLRIGLYILLPVYPSLWIILPVELLQGATFALAWSAGTVHCRKMAPKHLRSTVQSIFSGLYSGVGAGIGGLAGGFLYDAYGGKIMFTVAASSMAIGWILANFTNLVATATRGVRHSMKKVRELKRSFFITNRSAIERTG